MTKEPKPLAGAAKKTTDYVLAVFKLGNGLVSLMSGLLAAVLILYSGYVLYDSFSTEYWAKASAWDLLKYKPEIMDSGVPDEGAEKLAAINQDYRAWLTIHDTAIDYPVVQGTDDLYYASHDVYGNVSLTGAIYLAAGNSGDFSDTYNLVYGHHMDNGAMFGALDQFLDAAYFKAHQTGVVVAGNRAYDVTLFAAVSTDAYESQIYSVGNRADQVISFLTGDRDRDAGLGTKVMVYDAKAADGAKKIIALSTCANATTNGRLVLFGRMDDHEVKPVILTVHYMDGQDHAFPDVQVEYRPGSNFRITSPQRPGYRVDVRIVRGTIWEDLELVVTYTPIPQKLVVRYQYLDGKQAAKTYSGTKLTGEEYNVSSPSIPGYVPMRVKVAGTMPGRSVEYTVIYVPEGWTVFDDPETPLGLETTYLQVGICYE